MPLNNQLAEQLASLARQSKKRSRLQEMQRKAAIQEAKEDLALLTPGHRRKIQEQYEGAVLALTALQDLLDGADVGNELAVVGDALEALRESTLGEMPGSRVRIARVQ